MNKLPGIRPNKLLISSDFYSVQGEGISTGIPSYFIRLSQCNLNCGLSPAHIQKVRREGEEGLADGEVFTGDLEASGKATWTCDSISQWAIRGVNQPFEYLIERWKEQELLKDILDGSIHLIWTGGEPTMPQHQEAIANFLDYLGDDSLALYNEIETNGTYYIDRILFEDLNQINCSPKLANSGMSAKRRIRPEAIERIMEHWNYQFKFVISTEEDVEEIFETYVKPFKIPLKHVVCMPGMDSRDDYHERTRFVLEMAKKYRFRGLSRLHISSWGQTLNV